AMDTPRDDRHRRRAGPDQPDDPHLRYLCGVSPRLPHRSPRPRRSRRPSLSRRVVADPGHTPPLDPPRHRTSDLRLRRLSDLVSSGGPAPGNPGAADPPPFGEVAEAAQGHLAAGVRGWYVAGR